MARTLIGYGTTNSQGIATLDHNTSDESINGYTGTGAGELNITASAGVLESSTLTVWDYIRCDMGTTAEHNDIWNDMTCFTRGDESSRFYYDNTNGTSNKQVTFGSQITLTGNHCIEIETTSLTTSTARLQLTRYETGKTTTYNNAVLQNIGKYRIEVRDGVTYWYLNDNPNPFKTDSTQPSGSYLVTIITNRQTVSDFNFKNFKVYPIE